MLGRRRARLLRWTLLLPIAACAGSGTGASRPASSVTAPKSVTYVAVGASETVGVGADRPLLEAWPEVLRRSTLPAGTTFVNLGVSGSTVHQALIDQLPRAILAGPQLVTVWLNVNDAIRRVGVADYERDLAALVHGLRRGGVTQVLVANMPPLEDFPVVRACLPDPPAGVRCVLPFRLPDATAVRAYEQPFNEAIASVAREEGAVLVDLHAAAGSAGRSLDHYFAGDGFHPSTLGHAAIAAAFASRLRGDPRTSAFAR